MKSGFSTLPMTPTNFEGSNTFFTAPPDMSEEQVQGVSAYTGQIEGGSCDGVLVVVTAWKPSVQDIEAILAGKPVFLSCLGGLPPHFLTTDFKTAKSPA